MTAEHRVLVTARAVWNPERSNDVPNRTACSWDLGSRHAKRFPADAQRPRKCQSTPKPSSNDRFLDHRRKTNAEAIGMLNRPNEPGSGTAVTADWIVTVGLNPSGSPKLVCGVSVDIPA